VGIAKHQYELERRWHLAHPSGKKYQYPPRNPETVKVANRERVLNLKIKVLTHYGPQGKLQCAWPDCTVTDIDMLSLDHVNNDGAADRKKHTAGGCMTYCRVRRLGFPEGFQTLCHNHQWKKEILRRRAL